MPTVPPQDDARLRVLFVCQNDFSAPSEKQVLGFALELAQRGHEVLVSVGLDPETAAQEGATGIERLSVRAHRFARGRLREEDRAAARGFAPDLVHAWNSRVSTIAAARAMAEAAGAPVVVHFEDDEWTLPEHPPGTPLYRRVGHLARRAVSRVDPSVWWHSTRASLAWTRRHAAGFDALTPVLADEVERRLGRPCTTVLPALLGTEPLGGAADDERAAALVPHDDAAVLMVTGTLWPVYLPDFLVGLRAVGELQRRGRRVRWVHAGRVLEHFDTARLTTEAGIADGTASWLGYVPYTTVPALLRRADVLLQPGPPSDFNRLRLPSKMQAYLASGRPTVTFGAGFAELLEDRSEVLKTHTGDPGELADRVEELLDDAELRERLSRGGPAAAERLLDPGRNTDALLAHYRAVLGE